MLKRHSIDRLTHCLVKLGVSHLGMLL